MVITHQEFGDADILSVSLFTATDTSFFHGESKPLIGDSRTSKLILSFFLSGKCLVLTAAWHENIHI